MTRALTVALLFVAAACGAKDKPAATTPTGTENHEGGGGEGEWHVNPSAEMKAFHDLLAPRWHAEKGPKRTSDTCAARTDFKAAADAVAKATPPVATNADTWTNGTRALVAAVDDLDHQCTVAGSGDFDGVFAKVHDAFHVLMEQGAAAGGGKVQGKGGEHGPEHDEGHDHQP